MLPARFSSKNNKFNNEKSVKLFKINTNKGGKKSKISGKKKTKAKHRSLTSTIQG
jgi:hypothetical protein